MSSPLDRLVREAREDLRRNPPRQVDWAEVDEKLFARIEREEKRATPAPKRSVRLGWTAGAIVFAAAAAAALVVGRTSEPRPLESARETGPARDVVEEPAGSVVSVEGEGQLLVDGKPAAVGAALRLGSAVEARGGARAIIERPGKVTFLVEPQTRAVVSRAQGALILALERGSVEAQVAPVARGEAFAVDVGHARVAVHGTHLRVERRQRDTGGSDVVVVDLNEGVVLVGEAPRIGSTSGTLMTAPAHAEFAADDALGTLNVTHEAAQVRPPVALGSNVQPKAPAPAAAPASPSRPEAAADVHATAPAPVAPRVEPRPAPGGASSPQTPAADPNAESTIAAAVRACFAERPSPANVTVSVSTTLRLGLREDGSVRSARFDPPVAPEVNACAAPAIYRVRFTHGGSAAVSVDFREPSTSTP